MIKINCAKSTHENGVPILRAKINMSLRFFKLCLKYFYDYQNNLHIPFYNVLKNNFYWNNNKDWKMYSIFKPVIAGSTTYAVCHLHIIRYRSA